MSAILPKGKVPGGKRYHHGDVRKALSTEALQMVKESGVASLSLREVARRIGVSTAAPYFHFKDRQSLLIEIAVEGYGELLRKLEVARDGASSPEMQLDATAAAYLRFSRQQRAFFEVMFSGEFAGNERFEEMVAIASQSLALVAGCIARVRGTTPKACETAAFCAWSLLHGIATLNHKGILFESSAEQEALGIRGVRAVAVGV